MAENEQDDFELEPLPLDNVRKRGRPAGAINKKTVQLRQYLAGMGFRDPALVLAQTYSMPLEKMAAILDCDRHDAYKMQMNAAEALMPYLHGKMPLKVEVDDKPMPVVVLNMHTNAVEQRHEAARLNGQVKAMSIGAVLDTEVQENERFSELEIEKSHGEKSHGGGKLL